MHSKAQISCTNRLDNPVYDDSTGTHSQTNYNSSGPTYKSVGVYNETEYDTINQRGDSRPHPPNTASGSHDVTLSHDYSILERNNYYVIELKNMSEQIEEFDDARINNNTY